MHALDTILVDGRLQRVYKNLWPSLREFWLASVTNFGPDTYIVYEDQRLTYSQVHSHVLRLAQTLRRVYAIRKGIYSSLLSGVVVFNRPPHRRQNRYLLSELSRIPHCILGLPCVFFFILALPCMLNRFKISWGPSLSSPTRM